jgi:hypothetical protein
MRIRVEFGIHDATAFPMLHEPMRGFFTPLLILLSGAVACQVVLDERIDLTGPIEERRVDGLAVLPVSGDAALTVEGSVLGSANWAEASAVENTITLLPTIPLTDQRDGLLLRFIAPTTIQDSLLVIVGGGPSLPLVRPDGVAPVLGQVSAGTLCEILLANGRWILLNAPERGCPTGTLQLHERLCMEVVGQNDMLFFGAAERCADMGGRLCNWGEFHWACTQFGTELSGMLDSWEWVDEGANHAHSTVNVGFGNCNAERSSTPPITFARSRCCFDPR